MTAYYVLIWRGQYTYRAQFNHNLTCVVHCSSLIVTYYCIVLLIRNLFDLGAQLVGADVLFP